MKQNQQFQHLKAIEYGINKHLFIICAIVTIIVMAMTLIDFFTRGNLFTVQIAPFYLGVLLIYSLHKEIVRWLGQRSVERQGELFVYIWIGLTTALYVINFATKNYFSVTAEGLSINTLQSTMVLALEVLAIFIFTRFLKILKISLAKKHFLKKIKDNN
ncbi:MAG: hypothetical protein A2654_00725 [Candidatus Nealsonbacteria bacterium RIFCSPHIGHO2_01_FULL_43_31]|uniref:Uncharacterized protein n=2 Tax=Candidatus Nealsoniibacteriota TaxID=1817911 RepID=A0A1G2E7L4_9BACT|nr:MAG: hypothetical protein A2654_00725 [Candidatus Nealsonbacteria bacterium RIFCSPHIGHO2_01_FULL_43_31]OGZ21612.1 MAG: hypothetical protein A3D46_01100 [Candidatus Nealsonbacteria bacterium RIFCSPHIGHO2_02_FULL_43_13]